MKDLYTAEDEESREKPPPSITLTYPAHISQLRVEAEKSSLRKDVINAPAVKDDKLPLPMSEAGSPESKDIAPLFSPLQTVTMELALGEILTAINRERIRYVRVSAADPQDRIFLVSEIRKHCPNATIFMQGSDLLYLHSRSNFDFHGVLIISTYPLFALNQLWTYPFEGSERRLQFSTPNEEGIYNATLALLSREDLMLEYGLPFEEYNGGGQRHPALWLGIVGRNGIWPVKVFDVQPKEDSYTLSITTNCANSKPRLGLSGNYRSLIGVGFLLLLGGVCLVLSLCLLAQLSLFRELRHVWLRLRGGWLGRLLAWLRGGWLGRLLELPRRGFSRLLEWLRRGKLGQVFGDEKFDRYRLDRRINVLSCCASLLTVSLFTSGVAMLPASILWKEKDWGEDWKRHRVVGYAAFIILSLTVIAFIWLVANVLMWLYQHFQWHVLVLLWQVVVMFTFVYRGLWSVALIWVATGAGMWIISWWPHFLGRVLLSLALAVGWAKVVFDSQGASLVAFFWLAASLLLWIITWWSPHYRGLVWVSLALVVGGAMIMFIGRGLYEVFCGFEKSEKVFFFLRATELTSRVSVLLPALLVGLAAFLSFFTALRRWNLAEGMPRLRKPGRRPGAAPQFKRFDHEPEESFEGLKALEDRVKKLIVCPIFRMPGVALLTVLVTILILIVYWHFFWKPFIPSVDGLQFDQFFKLAFCVVPLMLVWALARSFWLWMAVRRLLRHLSWRPLISRYAAEHSGEKRFASLPPIDLMTPTPTYSALSLCVRQARSFYNALKPVPAAAWEREQIEKLVKKAESGLSDALGADAKGKWWEALRKRRYTQAALANLNERATHLLKDSWGGDGVAGLDAAWRDEGSFFLIAQFVAFLQHIFAHLQNLISLVTSGLLLMLLAANFYPFQPREPLLLFSWVGILASVVVTLYIFFSANRDETLSLLARTAPGKVTVTRDLVFRVLAHGVVPVVALLGLQFPEAVRQMFSWLNVFGGRGG